MNYPHWLVASVWNDGIFLILILQILLFHLKNSFFYFLLILLQFIGSRSFAQQNAGFPGRLAIIVHDSLADCIGTYADWKKRSGFEVEIIQLSELAPLGFVTASEIKASISELYNEPASLQYLLLIGDTDLLPPNYSSSLTLNDHQYTTLSGNDYIADIAVGRISVNNQTDCHQLIDKLIQYQFQPDTTAAWFDKAMVVAGQTGLDDYHGRHVRDGFLKNGFSVVDDLRYLNNMNTLQNVETGISQGRSWIFYIGHGTSTSWSDVNPFFSNDRLDSLPANQTYPVVISIGCSNADIDMMNGDCFGEKWMNSGQHKGAIAFISATENSAFYWSDTLGKYSLFSYLNRDAITLGDALNFGKQYLFNAIPQPAGGLTELTMQQHLLLGDPTLMPWTHTPRLPQLQIVDSIIASDSIFSLGVFLDGYPVQNVLAGLSSDNFAVHESALTDSTGMLYIPLSNISSDSLNLLITGFNLYPIKLKLPVWHPSGILNWDAIDFQLSPNPALQFIRPFWNQPVGDVAEIIISDLQGKTTLTKKIQQGGLGQIEISHLAGGVYIYQLRINGNLAKTGKLVVQ